jgi:hypothetical protein
VVQKTGIRRLDALKWAWCRISLKT